jgi:hypothetical protein
MDAQSGVNSYQIGRAIPASLSPINLIKMKTSIKKWFPNFVYFLVIMLPVAVFFLALKPSTILESINNPILVGVSLPFWIIVSLAQISTRVKSYTNDFYKSRFNLIMGAWINGNYAGLLYIKMKNMITSSSPTFLYDMVYFVTLLSCAIFFVVAWAVFSEAPEA